MREQFLAQGFTQLDQLITLQEVQALRHWYDELLEDKERTAGLRSDLSGGMDMVAVEKITQIMRPSLIEPKLAETNTYAKALTHARELLGEDMALDFDMLINKYPFTDTETPWHQDAAYWIELPDIRAVSCWIALDTVDEENGCMWFIPRDGYQVFEHVPIRKGGALQCTPRHLEAAKPMPLNPGGCTFHDGFTLHYSGGNRTNRHRRALILNFRPEKMIALERAQGMDHTGQRKVRQ